MRKILFAWSNFWDTISYPCPTRSVYGDEQYSVKVIVSSLLEDKWDFIVYVKSTSLGSFTLPRIELKGIANSKQEAMMLADEYLIKQGWLLLDREPQLAILLK